MNDAPHDPYRPYGQPEEPEGTGPVWGSAAGNEPEPTYPTYPAYHPPVGPQQGYPPAPGGYPPAPYGYGPPAYGPGPYAGHYSDKSKTTAGLLQLLLSLIGVCGVGRLYAGHTGVGVTQLVGFFASFCLSAVFIGLPFLVGIWLWSIIDGIIMLSSDSKDGQGRLLRS